MALKFFSSGYTNKTAISFISECINNLGGTASVSSTTLTYNGLFGQTEEKVVYMNNTSYQNMRFWYDEEAHFAFWTANHSFSMTNWYLLSSTSYFSGLGADHFLRFLAFEMDGVIYHLPSRTSSSDKTGIYKNYPFYIDPSGGMFQMCNLNALSLSMEMPTNDISLLPLIIGACVIPNLYFSVNNIAMTDQIVTIGEDQYKCLDSRLFYKIT